MTNLKEVFQLTPVLDASGRPRDVLPVRIEPAGKVLIGGQWRDVLPTSSTPDWAVPSATGPRDAIPARIVTGDTVTVNGQVRSVMPVSGFWTPTVLDTALLAWWDAARTDKITRDPQTAAVSSWRDQVGNYELAQAVNAARPIWNATSLAGRPGLIFNGAQELTMVGVPLPIGAAPVELWAVVEQTAPPEDVTGRFIVAYGSASATRRRISRGVGGGINRFSVGAGDGLVETSAANNTVEFTGRHVVRGIFRANNVQADVDGVVGAPVAVVPATTGERLRVGANSGSAAGGFWLGQVSAFLAIDPTKPEWTADAAAKLLAYLNA